MWTNLVTKDILAVVLSKRLKFLQAIDLFDIMIIYKAAALLAHGFYNFNIVRR